MPDEPSTIVSLSVDRELVCTSQTVKAAATVTPQGEGVTWSIEGGRIISSGGVTAHFFCDPGKTTITATADSGRMSRTVKSGGIKIAGLDEIGDITSDAVMPQLKASIVIFGSLPAGTIEWTATFTPEAFFEGCSSASVPFPLESPGTLGIEQSGTGQDVTIDIGDRVVGGTFRVSARLRLENHDITCHASGNVSVQIGGTNPVREQVRLALPHDTLRRIACVESGQRQFDALPDGEKSNCPLFAEDGSGKVGVMQVPNPSLEEAWNWKANVKKGIELFGKRVDEANQYPGKVRETGWFKDKELLNIYNQERRQGEKPLDEIVLRDFSSGGFSDGSLGELELDAIRGYNGWPEIDPEIDIFQLGLHEYRVAFEDIEKKIIQVENIRDDPQTGKLIGDAVWERVPVEDRPQNKFKANYVNEVLALTPACLPASPIPPPQPVVIEHVFLMLDDFSQPLDWNEHVIGLHPKAQKINIQIVATASMLDSSLSVELTTRAPNGEPGATSLISPKQVEVFRDNEASQQSGRAVYRRTINISDCDPIPRLNQFLEVATIVRPDGTSDKFFRDALGWSPRGISTMPGSLDTLTGNEVAEVPDASQLLKAGGVEVLEVKINNVPEGVILSDSKSPRLVRSPADIVYISGHGLFDRNCIAIDRTPANTNDNIWDCWGRTQQFKEWKQVSEELAIGDVESEPEVLIFAGCSLLTINKLRNGDRVGPGLKWADLLHTKNGSLKAILGYRKWRNNSAPADSRGGNKIAREFGTIVAEKAKSGEAIDYVQEWLKINKKHKAWTATGINAAGYWKIQRKSLVNWSYKIVGPLLLI